MHDEKVELLLQLKVKCRRGTKKLKVIEAIPYVSSADMQMSYSEEAIKSYGSFRKC